MASAPIASAPTANAPIANAPTAPAPLATAPVRACFGVHGIFHDSTPPATNRAVSGKRTLSLALPPRFPASSLTARRARPYSDSFSSGELRARAPFSSHGEQDHRSHGASGRPDDVHDDGVRGGRQPAHSFRSGHARGRRAFRHVHIGRSGDAGDGPLGELSDRAGARNVAERVFHVFDRDRPRRAVADGAGSGAAFRAAVS